MHNRRNGQQSESITRYSNMFSVFFGYLDQSKQQAIKHSVLLNDSILKITTPYMRFYELEALCSMGMQTEVLKEIKAYWGGMLREGAPAFGKNIIPKKVEHSIWLCTVVLMAKVFVMRGVQALSTC